MERKEIIQALEEMAVLLELRGENPFKVKAYSGAGRVLAGLDEAVFVEHMRNGTIAELKGIGRSMADRIHGLFEEGQLRELEELRKSTPPGVLQMLRVAGLGPKKIKTLRDALGIDTLSALEAACLDNRVRDLPGFGEKSQAKILEGVRWVKQQTGYFSSAEALAAAAEVQGFLATVAQVQEVEATGELRRFAETFQRLALLIVTNDPAAVQQQLERSPLVESLEKQNGEKLLVTLAGGLPADLLLVAPPHRAWRLFETTGCPEHVQAVRERINPQGVPSTGSGMGETTAYPDEVAIYTAAGLPFIPPELRENRSEIEAAAAGKLPEIVTDQDILGVVHAHSTYSDGADSIEAMARACIQRGYRYLVLCDHSQSAFYAGGLKADDLRRQHAEIDRLNSILAPFRIFKGIEVEILRDGDIDYPEEVLANFELVIASVHSAFQLPAAEQTQRVLRSLHNPHVDMIGHPTGRLLLGRSGYNLDMNALIAEAARCGTAIELNAHPLRLDLNWENCHRAKEAGVIISINPDAHAIDGIDDIRFGVLAARKGWLARCDVLNCLDADELMAWRRQRLSRRQL